MKCTLDGRRLTAVADTGSDLNFMSPKCAKNGGFDIDTNEEARICVRLGDGTEVESTGQVYVYSLSLDWRKPVTETPPSVRQSTDVPLLADTDESASFSTIFHVLPGLVYDVILGLDVLDRMDAFNGCSELSCTQTASSNKPYELNILISRWKRKQKVAETPSDPKEIHDDERHVEMHRRSRRRGEIAQVPEDERAPARDGERVLVREWDTLHTACIYCNSE